MGPCGESTFLKLTLIVIFQDLVAQWRTSPGRRYRRPWREDSPPAPGAGTGARRGRSGSSKTDQRYRTTPLLGPGRYTRQVDSSHLVEGPHLGAAPPGART